MKHLLRYISLSFLLLFIIPVTAGCADKALECPFTTAAWDSTLEDIKSLEGEVLESYDSAYNGTTYAFSKKYNELEGTVKYGFDDKEKLVSISWLYETDDSEDLTEVYDKIHKEAEDALGESGFSYNSDKFADIAIPGDVWYRKEGNIIITAVDTEDAKLLQYTFLHPDVSEEAPKKQEG